MLLWYSLHHFSVFDVCFSWWQSRMTSSFCWTNAIACSAAGSSPESSTISNTINTYPRTTRDEGTLLFRIFQILDYLPVERLRMEGKEQAKLCLGSNGYQRILAQPWGAAPLTLRTQLRTRAMDRSGTCCPGPWLGIMLWKRKTSALEVFLHG